MTQQDTFFILAPVLEGRADELMSLLERMTLKPGLADPDNSLVPFGSFDRLHVARFFLVEANTWRDIEVMAAHPNPIRCTSPSLGMWTGIGRASSRS